MRLQPLVALLCCAAMGQQLSIQPIRPAKSILVRPYEAATVPPVRLNNSQRLQDLVRAGTIYLTVQDAIALALENNIDIEVARYGPLLAEWQLERAQAGGALPGVPNSASQAGSVASGQGVAGSQAAAGVVSTGGTSTASRSGNATISQVGPVTQTLDPSITDTTVFSHTSIPQFNVVQSGTPNLISSTHVYNVTLQEGFLSGGGVTLSYSDHYLKENASSDLLNPSVAPNLSISFQHNLLRGFGVAVNARTITVSKINLQNSDPNFRTTVSNIVVRVLASYYSLAADYEDLKAKRRALEVSQTFYSDNKRQAEIGTLAPLDVTTAESQMAASQQAVEDSLTTLQNEEIQLKNLLSRTGTADPVLSSVRVVPVDRITMPDKDDIPSLSDMLKTALANRSDLEAEKANERASEISALGTRNGLLPTSQVLGGETQAGLAGVPKTIVINGRTITADPYVVGGIGNALGQVFRRNYPTERIGAYILVPIHNRQAQADFGIDQLQLRQTQLNLSKDISQVGVDLLNYAVALRQARARYEAAVKNRVLTEQLLSAEQEKFTLGASTPYNVVQQQRDLTTSQAAELAALVSYSNARLALDQTLGITLEANHVSIAEAKAGKVARTSTPVPPPEPSR
ncbi:MAG TPA: TolC family protein [Bryobacteraceae bacterium]|nr:TolC family protein [Bryobacteraceae bacterium]